ncbi:MAG: FAD:protein FMN transferase [Spirochaetaceae bacterium]|nr:FAD:protein FMN transferase [Spirochaetaceae bacterium]
MKRNACLVLVVIFASLLLFSCKPQKYTESFNAMNTFMTVQAYGSEKKAKAALEEAKSRVASIEDVISTTKSGSDLYKLNHSFGASMVVRDDTAFLFEFTNGLYKATNGALNPALYPIISAWGFTTESYRIPSEEEITALLSHTDFSQAELSETAGGAVIKTTEGMKLDFGAVGKGYAGDEIIRILKEHGIKSALLDLGGNVQVIGKKTDGSKWVVGIKNPWGGDSVCTVKIADLAVVTSGGYERFFVGDDGKKYIHIFDPKTGHPVENDLESVTIICERGLYADALSTSLFVMGKDKAVEWWYNNSGFDFILITTDNEFYYSSGLNDDIQVIYPFNAIYAVTRDAE